MRFFFFFFGCEKEKKRKKKRRKRKKREKENKENHQILLFSLLKILFTKRKMVDDSPEKKLFESIEKKNEELVKEILRTQEININFKEEVYILHFCFVSFSLKKKFIIFISSNYCFLLERKYPSSSCCSL